MTYRKITREELDKILRKHKLWLENKKGGERADLSGLDLSYVNLSGVNLSYANLSKTDLSEANFTGATLWRADLSCANLSLTNLRGADLSFANLSLANLSGADLSEAKLSGANLLEANLVEANLSKSNLNSANLLNAELALANLQGADLDFSALPLWCGSLGANFDDRQLVQFAYHLVKAGLRSNNASEETKVELAKLIDFANKFHRVVECGKIEARSEGK